MAQKGMEFFNEYILVEDLNDRLEELSQDDWSVQSIAPGFANVFEMGTRGIVLVILKRPKKNKD